MEEACVLGRGRGVNPWTDNHRRNGCGETMPTRGRGTRNASEAWRLRGHCGSRARQEGNAWGLCVVWRRGVKAWIVFVIVCNASMLG